MRSSRSPRRRCTAATCCAWACQTGDVVTVRSRRGNVALSVRRDDGMPTGAVFIPFAYYEAAANLLTNAALDPFGKIPEFKYCAVAVTKGGVAQPMVGFSREGELEGSTA